MMKKMAIPAGFRFRPTEEELINSYLRPKIMGQILPCNIVEEKQLYGGDPWDVLHDENQWMVSETDKLGKIVKKTIYVFTHLTKKAAAGKLRKNGGGGGGKEQFVRAAGCGTWDGQTGPREIKNGNGQVIGFRKMLVFEIRDINPNRAINEKGHYIMHEYSVPVGESNYVLCEIILDLNKRSKRKRGVAEESEEEVANPKRLTPNNEEKKDEENTIICSADNVPVVHEVPLPIEYPPNFIICSADVPAVHDEGGSSCSGMESSQVPLSVPNTSSSTDHESVPMMESQQQTLEWELGDLLQLAELLDSHHESDPSSGMESHLPIAVEYPNTSTDELMPMTESQKQTMEWGCDDFIELEELLDSDHETGPYCVESQVPLGVEYPNTGTTADHVLMPMRESDQEQTLEWDDLFNVMNSWTRSSIHAQI